MTIHPIADIVREHAGGNARPLLIASAEFLGQFKSDPAKCHDNARRWVEQHPEYGIVEGWIPVDPTFLFFKHSVVTKSDGKLICVTLGSQREIAPSKFIVHNPAWDAATFAELPAAVRTGDALIALG
jgi:hypothetical protein